jgi:hypothetical protein
MPQYTLTLTQTAYGRLPDPGSPLPPPHNADSLVQRQKRALRVARGLGVSATLVGPGTTANTFLWDVQGADADICDMIAVWTRWNNVTVSGGPNCTNPS